MTETASTPPPPASAGGPLDDLAAKLGGAPPMAQGPRHANVVETNFGDESITASDFEVYKGRKNHRDRIAVLSPKSVVYARVHYIDNKGYYICQSEFEIVNGQEIPRKVMPCCDQLDMPKKRFSVPVVHFNTTPEGGLIKPFGFRLKVWRFTEATFVSLRGVHKEFGLDSHDLLVGCEDDQYQKLTIQPAKDSIIKVPDFVNTYSPLVDAFLAAITPKLERACGRRADASEWRELLGGVGAGPAGAVAVADGPPQDIAELLKNL